MFTILRLIAHFSAALTPELLYAVLGEVPPLLSESDLHIAQLTLHLLTSVARKQRSALQAGGVSSAILPEVFNLLRSPLLQGGALSSLLEFLQALVEFNPSGWYLAFGPAHESVPNYFCDRIWAWISRFALRSYEPGL